MDFLIARDPLLHVLHQLSGEEEQAHTESSPAKAYLRERNAMASTAVDVKEYPSSYVFVADMPGLKSSDIKVTVESGNMLVLSGKRKREEEKGESEAKYVVLERKATKFMRKFTLPSNADADGISAACQDGVLTVTVPKVPPPAPKVISVEVK